MEKWLQQIPASVQRSAVLGTANILHKTLRPMVKALSFRTTQIQLYIFNYLFRLKKNFFEFIFIARFLPC